MKKRFLAVFLALALCVRLMPTVFADGSQFYLSMGEGTIKLQVHEGWGEFGRESDGTHDEFFYVSEPGYYSFTAPPSFSGYAEFSVHKMTVSETGLLTSEYLKESIILDPNRQRLSYVWLEPNTWYTLQGYFLELLNGGEFKGGTVEGEYDIITKFWGNMTPIEKFCADGISFHTIKTDVQDGDIFVSDGYISDDYNYENIVTVWSGRVIKFGLSSPAGFNIGSISINDETGKIKIPWTTDSGLENYAIGHFTMPDMDVILWATYIPLFIDLKPNAYYLKAVDWAVREGITTGKTETTFAPDEACTHAQILTFLWRAAGEPESSAQSPIAMKGDEFYYKAVKWAAEKGMVGANFNPKADCTRADAVSYIWQAKGRQDFEYGGQFTDVSADSPYATAVAWTAGYRITTGTTATTFSPNKICNRGEIVTFLHRAYVGVYEW